MCRKKGELRDLYLKRLKKIIREEQVENFKLSADVKLARYYQEVIKNGIHTVSIADIDYLELGHILTKAITYYKLDIRTDLDIGGEVITFQKNSKTIKSDDRLERLGVENVK